jgi:hypothetical protein
VTNRGHRRCFDLLCRAAAAALVSSLCASQGCQKTPRISFAAADGSNWRHEGRVGSPTQIPMAAARPPSPGNNPALSFIAVGFNFLPENFSSALM